MAIFVDEIIVQQWAPPYIFKDVTWFVSIIAGDLHKQSFYCDTYLNAQPGQKRPYLYEPILPFAYVIWAVYGEMRLSGAGRQLKGSIGQNEAIIVFPVLRHGGRHGNLLLDAEIDWAYPFIAVDQAPSVITGREVLGFGKMLMDVEQTAGSDGSRTAAFSVNAFKNEGYFAQNEMQKLIQVSTGAPASPGPGQHLPFPWSDHVPPEMRKHLKPGVEDVLQHSKIATLRAVNLQQLRDAANPLRAAYQALVLSAFAFQDVGGLTFYPDASITTYPVDSTTNHYTGKHMWGGPGADRIWPIKPLTSFSFTCNMTLESVERPYVAPIPASA
jgi:hypothetical protein